MFYTCNVYSVVCVCMTCWLRSTLQYMKLYSLFLEILFYVSLPPLPISSIIFFSGLEMFLAFIGHPTNICGMNVYI